MSDEYEIEYEDMDALVEEIDLREGVLTVETWQVRDAYGAERLGSKVRTSISRDLRGRGVGHFPTDLPDRGKIKVRLYKIASPAGALIEAVQVPDLASDDVLRTAAGGDAEATLEQIRELVCP